MRFGIFYEHQCPRPWDDGKEARIIHEALEQVQLADELGFDTVWEVQHHFVDEYSHSSAPEVFLAACAATTKNIGLGHGIVPVLPGFSHPARVAEQIATLDIISHGRVQFGTGESTSRSELDGFEIEGYEKREMWEEALPQITRMMAQEPYPGYQGKYFSMPPRNVVPKPIQKPHPPVWVACSRRETIHLAGTRGIGALSFAFLNPEEARLWVTDYYNALEECKDPIAVAANANLAVVSGFMCHEDEAVARERGLEGFDFFVYSLNYHFITGTYHPGKTSIWDDFKKSSADQAAKKAQEEMLAAKDRFGRTGVEKGGAESLTGCIGSVEQVRSYLRGMEEAGVDEIIFTMQAGNNKHEHIIESMKLFAKEVMPEFKERRPDIEARKAERLAPTLERLNRLAAVDEHPDLGDYAIVAEPY
jgi:alkanesulfonate monooxygenase SsuD/methylene tetrahydromethanopterin reductase-like flavin-dependent oxidoreductase (luciferase family)